MQISQKERDVLAYCQDGAEVSLIAQVFPNSSGLVFRLVREGRLKREGSILTSLFCPAPEPTPQKPKYKYKRKPHGLSLDRRVPLPKPKPGFRAGYNRIRLLERARERDAVVEQGLTSEWSTLKEVRARLAKPEKDHNVGEALMRLYRAGIAEAKKTRKNTAYLWRKRND